MNDFYMVLIDNLVLFCVLQVLMWAVTAAWVNGAVTEDDSDSIRESPIKKVIFIYAAVPLGWIVLLSFFILWLIGEALKGIWYILKPK